MSTANIEAAVAAWQPYIETIGDWQELVGGLEPKPTGCGPVYEPDNPLPDRGEESFAIADMRDVFIAEPHYHPNGETEIYFVLTGVGKVVVGGKENPVKPGSVVVTPPDTAHFTIPEKDLVIAVVNVPSFNPDNYVPVTDTDKEVGFDNEQLARLAVEAYRSRGLIAERGSDKPGTVYEPHSHEQTHLYTIAGSLDIKAGDRPKQTVKAHQEFVVGGEELHEAVVGPDGWEYVAAWDEDEAKKYEHEG